MYKINLYFKSNIDGVYTKEEETAKYNEEYENSSQELKDSNELINAKFKRNRMVDKWFCILCPHIDYNVYLNNVYNNRRHLKYVLNGNVDKRKYNDDIEFKLKYDLITETLHMMDVIDEEITGKETTEKTRRQFTITMEKIL